MKRWVLGLLLVVAGCTEPRVSGLKLLVPSEASPGASFVVRAYVAFDGRPVPGATVRFEAESGLFGESGDHTASAQADDDGFARVTYRAPPFDFEPSDEAKAVGRSGDGALDSIAADWVDPIQGTAREVKAVGHGPWPLVDGSSFRFGCEGRTVQLTRSVTLDCSVQSTDGLSPTDRYGFLAEAGRLGVRRWPLSSNPIPKEPQWTYAYQGRDPAPVDVDPEPGEPSWEVSGGIANPRDGIATLVAYTMGTPDPVLDAEHGEPFVDEDDDGAWSEGETYVDSDGNGRYTEADEMDPTAPRMLWRSFKIMLAGRPRFNIPPEVLGRRLFEPSSLLLPPDAEGQISLLLLDVHLNPVGAICDLRLLAYTGRWKVASGTLEQDPWRYELDPVRQTFTGWPPLGAHAVTLTTDASGRIDGLACEELQLDAPEAVPGGTDIERLPP